MAPRGWGDAYIWDSTPDLVSDVQAWLDDPSSNSGWILIRSVEGTNTFFHSRESAFTPRLEVEYQPETQAPAADFSWSPESPSAGQPVQFTDLSTHHPTRWSWDFDDGTISAEPAPQQQFPGTGTYTVQTVCNSDAIYKV